MSAGPGDVAGAYTARAREYADRLGRVDALSPVDRRRIEEWAGGVTGAILDAGCGPGHLTAYLADLGHDASGIDPADAFVEIARERHPGITYLQGEFADLAATPARYGGILAWYSLIHLPPHEVPPVLELLHDALAPGGSLLLGFFAGGRIEAFDHAITPAWYWPPREVRAALDEAGFDVIDADGRRDPGVRPHADVSARRR